MKALKFLLTLAGVILAAGAAAFGGTAFLAWADLLGSCFEGGCGYAAVYFWFPLLWLVFSIAGCVIWVALHKRHSGRQQV